MAEHQRPLLRREGYQLGPRCQRSSYRPVRTGATSGQRFGRTRCSGRFRRLCGRWRIASTEIGSSAYLVMTDATAIPYAQNPTLWDQAGFTIAGYQQAHQHMYQTYRQAFRKTPLAVAIDGFTRTNAQALRGQPEEKALRELLEFAGGAGFLFFFTDDMSRARPGNPYIKDEILLPAVRKFALRSQVLVMLRPDERTLREGSNGVVQVAQERWPDLPIRAVVLAQAKASTPGRQVRPVQIRPARRLLVLGDTPGS